MVIALVALGALVGALVLIVGLVYLLHPMRLRNGDRHGD